MDGTPYAGGKVIDVPHNLISISHSPSRVINLAEVPACVVEFHTQRAATDWTPEVLC